MKETRCSCCLISDKHANLLPSPMGECCQACYVEYVASVLHPFLLRKMAPQDKEELKAATEKFIDEYGY